MEPVDKSNRDLYHPLSKMKGGVCMKGRIYESKKKRKDGRPYGWTVRFGKEISKWFTEYLEAERFLNFIRYQVDQNKFDARDYESSQPLAFCNLAKAFLEIKQDSIKPKSYNNLKNYLNRAKKSWSNKNIKMIDYAMIEDFIFAQNVSDKTRSNIKSGLHSFFVWCRKRRYIEAVPEFPEVPFELGFRNLIEIPTQQRIINEIYEISKGVNIKIWIAIKFLSTYVSIRPGEMLNVRERDLNLSGGFIVIPHPKEKKPKIASLLDEDKELLKAIPRGLPDLFFFRHPAGLSGAKAGERFGNRYLYKYWKKACANLKIEGIDLYGGTRHSTVTALSEHLTPEQIKAGTLHSTNKAFERYFRAQATTSKLVHETARHMQSFHNFSTTGVQNK
jgi:integrase